MFGGGEQNIAYEAVREVDADPARDESRELVQRARLTATPLELLDVALGAFGVPGQNEGEAVGIRRLKPRIRLVVACVVS